MQTSRAPSALADALTHQLAGFAWDQWSQMGVSGHTERRDPWSMDPEALLLFTLQVARSESRLFDEVLDWMRMNLELISAQRLTNFARDGEAERLASAALSWASSHTTRATRQGRPPRREAKEPDPLFVGWPSAAQIREPDPNFIRYGFIRPRLEPSHRSRPPARSAPINFSFRLRDLFGVSTRAEVVRVLLLLTGVEVRPREMVQVVGYSRQNVYEALNALVSAGVIWMKQKGPRDRSYVLDEGRWAALLDIDADELPLFIEWPRLLDVLAELLAWMRSVETKGSSNYMLASEARRFVAEHENALHSLGIKPPDARRFLGADYWAPFEELVVEGLLHKLEGKAEAAG